jgi:hypothetical protein
MKFSFAAFLCCLAAACTTTSPKLPQNVQPIVGSIIIGVRPVERGQQIDATKITLSENGRTQSMTLSIQSQIDVARTAEELMIRLEVLNAAVDISNADASEVAGIQQQLGQLPGTVFTLVVNMRTREERQKIRTGSFDVDMAQERSAGITRSIRDGYMGGMAVYQNQEVARGKLSELLPTVNLGDISGASASRIISQTVYAGRSVVAVSTEGSLNFSGTSASLRGISLVDIATGVPIFSDFVLSGLRAGSSVQDIAMSQRLTIYGS